MGRAKAGEAYLLGKAGTTGRIGHLRLATVNRFRRLHELAMSGSSSVVFTGWQALASSQWHPANPVLERSSSGTWQPASRPCDGFCNFSNRKPAVFRQPA
jgi:hypothetical protein